MKKFFIILSSLLLIGTGAVSLSNMANADNGLPVMMSVPAAGDNFNYSAYQTVNPLDVVAKPAFYLNKNIKITGKFDKFSTLGLDYEPAFRSSENYISFLIQRPDVSDHNLPLSEMKCFITRTDAEKYIELTSGDRVEFYGTVFSNALGDVWVDVKKFNSLDKKPVEKK